MTLDDGKEANDNISNQVICTLGEEFEIDTSIYNTKIVTTYYANRIFAENNAQYTMSTKG